MTLQELKNMVDDMVENGVDTNSEVRLVYQQNYPLQDHVDGITTLEEINGADNDPCPTPTNIVYIVSGGQVAHDPYGPRAAFELAQR